MDEKSQNFYGLQKLPNSTASLVLGIISIVTCWCLGVVGLVLGIIGLIMSSKAISLYKQSPDLYEEVSYKNANAGKICSIIGLALSALYIVYLIIIFPTYLNMVWSLLEGSYNI